MRDLYPRKLSLQLATVVSLVFLSTACISEIESCPEPSSEPYLSIQLLDNTQAIDSVTVLVAEELPVVSYLAGADTAIGISMNHDQMEVTVHHRTGPTLLTIFYGVRTALDEQCGAYYLGLQNVRVRMEGPLRFTDVFNPFDPATRNYTNDLQLFLFP